MFKKALSILSLLGLIVALFACGGKSIETAETKKNEYKEGDTIVEAISFQYDNANDFHEGLAPVEFNGKWGYIDKRGNKISDFIYNSARTFSNGLGCVGIGEPAPYIGADDTFKYGFINKSGREIVPIIYEYASDFSDGLSGVSLNGKAGFIDTNGKEVIPLNYDGTFSFSEGLGGVIFDATGNSWEEKMGYVDKEGKMIIPQIYDASVLNEEFRFSEGLSKVSYNYKYGFIDHKGDAVIPFQYSSAGNFSEGLSVVSKEGKYGYIDKNGKEVIPLKYDYAFGFSEGIAYVRIGEYFTGPSAINNKSTAKCGFIDRDGNEITEFKYDPFGMFGPDSIVGFSEGRAKVYLNNKFGYIDKKGNEVIPIKYDAVSDFSEGLAAVKMNNKYGYIDKNGKEVTSFKYDYAADFHEGFAAVYLNGKYGYISYLPEYSASKNNDYYYKNGNMVTSTWVEGHYYGDDGKMYRNRKTPDGKFVNTDGDVVDVEKDFKEIDKNEVEGNAWFKTKNGIWYYFEGDRTTLKKGWFTDPQDNQTYYLDPQTGIMQTGWQKIDGKEYYFNESHDNEPNWYYVAENDTYESYGKKVKAYGSMFKNETTPDGHYVDANGVKDGKDTVETNNSNDILNGISNLKCVKDYSSNTTFDKMNTITFGSYTQNGSNEPAEWLLLDKQDGKALLISKYVLDCKPYNETSASVDWDNSTLKTWLNNDFMNSVFSSDEKNSILSVTIPSINDMNNYFNDDEARKAIATKYAKDNGCWVSSQFLINGEGTVCYFLSDNGDMMDKAAFVGDSGKIGTWGSRVNLGDCGIRPAIWVKYNGAALSGEKENSSGSNNGLNNVNSGSSSGKTNTLNNTNSDSGSSSNKYSSNAVTGSVSGTGGTSSNSSEGGSKNTAVGISSGLSERQKLMKQLYDEVKSPDYRYKINYDKYAALNIMPTQDDNIIIEKGIKFDENGNLWFSGENTKYTGLYSLRIIDKNNNSDNKIYEKGVHLINGLPEVWQLDDGYEEAMQKFYRMEDGINLINNLSLNSSNNLDNNKSSGSLNTLASQINNVKCITDYPEDTTVDQMDTIIFGNYYQSNDSTKEPIEWIVLEKQGDLALIVSKKILNYIKYYDFNKVNWADDDMHDWGKSNFRRWLNEEFIPEAFNSEEKEHFVKTMENDKIGILSRHMLKKYFGIYNGKLINSTQDFILDLDDSFGVNYYYLFEREILKLVVKPTQYAINNYNNDLKERGSDEEYWIESEANSYFLYYDNDHPELISSYSIGHSDGLVDDGGLPGVRPAMWVKIN